MSFRELRDEESAPLTKVRYPPRSKSRIVFRTLKRSSSAVPGNRSLVAEGGADAIAGRSSVGRAGVRRPRLRPRVCVAIDQQADEQRLLSALTRDYKKDVPGATTPLASGNAPAPSPKPAPSDDSKP